MAGTNPETDPAAFVFFNEIGIIEQLARAQFEKVLPGGLKISQFGVLNHFVRMGDERSPAELARLFQVTKGAMTNTLHRLEARGLVEVAPHPSDGRFKVVRITEEGRRTREACIAALAPLLADLGREFDAAEFAAALPFLQRIRAFLDTHRDLA